MKNKNFTEYYSSFLAAHSNRICRRLHFIGTLLSLILLLYSIFTFNWIGFIIIPFIANGFAMVGHFWFEKNKPGVLTSPLYSFVGNLVMFKDIIFGKIKF